MQRIPTWIAPALLLAAGCANDVGQRATQPPEAPDTLHLLAAFRSEVGAQLDVLSRRVGHLTAIRPDTPPVVRPDLERLRRTAEERIAALESRLTTLAFHDTGHWRTTKQQVDSAVDVLRADVARTEFRTRHPP